jgi:peptidyl-prolyl cis-trans isomerase C
MRREMRKESKTNYFSILLISILLTFCLAGISSAAEAIKKDTGEKGRKVVARVNGQPIYEDQLAPDVAKGQKKFKKYGVKRKSDSLVKRLQKKALDKVISQELIYQESRKINIPDIEEKISEKIQATRKRYKSEEHFEKSLKAKKLTNNDFKESVRKSIYVDEYLKKEGVRNPEVPEAEIKDFYEGSKDSFKREESVRVSHILIKVNEEAKPEEKQQARERAEKIRQEISEGKDFAEMAKKYSEDGNASKGGDLSYIKKGYMPSEFDEVAFSLEKGKVSEVVQTRHGYHIIQVLDKKPEGIAPYNEVKNFIGKFLQERLAQKKLASHIEELKKKAKIEILLNGS